MTRKRLVLGAVVTALAIAGGAAYAAIPVDTVFNACMLNATGTIRLVDPAAPAGSLRSRPCVGSLETAISFSQRGPAGLPGKDGTNGAPGLAGPQGPVGKDGKDGLNGHDGAAGATGLAGAAGVPGDTGAAGLSGVNGAPGPTGATGPQGPVGPAGTGGAGPYTLVPASALQPDTGSASVYKVATLTGGVYVTATCINGDNGALYSVIRLSNPGNFKVVVSDEAVGQLVNPGGGTTFYLMAGASPHLRVTTTSVEANPATAPVVTISDIDLAYAASRPGFPGQCVYYARTSTDVQ